ncbi:MAG: hypothetical protein KAS48_07950 [Gammaproteobacteria bacterium]|nr:hypothetical protein [Gammaproteobacteria bacterium]
MNLFGIVVTILYIGVIVSVRWTSIPELTEMPLNEFGDFFAGVFGPLMLFWLIMGYIQQQKELQQNTAALELQAEELKKSVEQHKELVKATKEQVQADLKALEIEQVKSLREAHPVFSIMQSGQYKRSGDNFALKITIKNIGMPASSVSFSTDPEIKQILQKDLIPYFDTGNTVNLVWDTVNSGDPPKILKLIINCRDSNTNQYTKTFDFSLDDNHQYHLISIEDVS